MSDKKDESKIGFTGSIDTYKVDSRDPETGITQENLQGGAGSAGTGTAEDLRQPTNYSRITEHQLKDLNQGGQKSGLWGYYIRILLYYVIIVYSRKVNCA